MTRVGLLFLLGFLLRAVGTVAQPVAALPAPAVDGGLDPAPIEGVDPHSEPRASSAASKYTVDGLARTASALSAAGSWDERFGLAGVNGAVNTFAVNGSTVIIGGAFDAAGSVPARGLATWNGTVWSELGGGVNGAVFAVAVSGSKVYVGGRFSKAGNVAASNIAVWDGAAWSALAGGLSGAGDLTAVYALDVAPDGSLYAGGYFTTAGAVSAVCIARWNAGVWSALGSGTSSAVYAVEATAAGVYVGGRFLKAGGVTVNRIARYDGAWQALGLGADNDVFSLVESAGVLYAGGAFTKAGAVSAARVARWDGAQWAALGSGLDGTVFSLVKTGTGLFVGGTFDRAGGILSPGLALWNNAWAGSGAGISAAESEIGVFALAQTPGSFPMAGQVLAGGSFDQAGPVVASSLALWNPGAGGGTWTSPGTGDQLGASGAVRAMAAYGGLLYVGGYFSGVGTVDAGRIAVWNGSAWSSLAKKLSEGSVLALDASASGLFAGGTFEVAGGSTVGAVAHWNGSTWNTMQGGVSKSGTRAVYAIAASGSGAYVGGDFEQAGSVPAANIARWDGAAWQALGAGVTGGTVLALAVGDGGVLYVGGSFRRAGGSTISYLARWNGTSWSSVGGGTNGEVHALAYYRGKLYAGGHFTRVGTNVTAHGIAVWDGTKWSALGAGLDGDAVSAIAVLGSRVYAGGNFTMTGGNAVNHVAEWNGSQWLPLHVGTNGPVRAIEVIGASVFAGGYFSQAGATASAHFGRWVSDSAELSCPLGAGWNLVSTNLSPVDLGMSSVLSGVVSKLELVRDNAGLVYWPSQQIDLLSEWRLTEGYDIYMNASASWAVTGSAIPQDQPIPLRGGWNIIPFVPQQPMSTTEAFGSLAGSFVLVKDVAGRPYWPSEGIDLIQQLVPCQAYRIYVSVSEATFQYPGGPGKWPGEVSFAGEAGVAQEGSRAAGPNGTLVAQVEGATEGATVQARTAAGDVVAEGTIRAGRLVLVIRGADPLAPQSGGAREGELLELLETDGATGAVRPLTLLAVRDGLADREAPVSDLRYRNNGAWVVAAELNRLDRGLRLRGIYPNPAGAEISVALDAASRTVARLSLFDAVGREVAVARDGLLSAGRHDIRLDARGLSAGTYFMRIATDEGVVVRPIVIAR